MSDMKRILSDNEIQSLIADEKPITSQIVKQLKPKPLDKRKHMECEQDIESVSGKKFRIRVRLNSINPHDFSVILSYFNRNDKSWYVLRRYNGNSHRHTNKIEKTKFVREYHIHQATERYQMKGLRIEEYAEPTEAYSNWRDALSLMLIECNFKMQDTRLF